MQDPFQGPKLSGSHRSTRIASNLASRALASQAKPQQESESQAFHSLDLKKQPIFASQANIAGFSQDVLLFFLRFLIKLTGFRIASEKNLSLR